MSMQLDGVDVQIIEILQADGRVMYKDVAKKVGISLPTVRSRIRRLLELGVIKKFTVIVDPDKIFGKVRGIMLIQADPLSIEEAVSRLSSMKEVKEIYTTAGSSPIVLKVEVKDLAELGEFTSKKLSGISGVARYSILVITKTVKEEYGASVEANSMLQFKCDFCHAPILGRPYIEYIGGGRYYFNAERCAKAYKQMKLDREGR